MVMKFRTIRRHIREGFKNIYRNGWMTIASIGAVTMTLLLVGVFLALILNLNQMANKIEQDVEMKVFIELTADEEDITALGEEIERISEVDSVRFSSNTDELYDLVESLGEDWLFAEDDNPLNHAYIVRATDPRSTENVASEIEGLPHVEKVNFGKDVVQLLFKFNTYARNIGIVLVVGLLLTAIFLISNTIKLTIMARSTEIGIMKLVGATNNFIRWPFFVEGMLLGILGAIVPIGLIMTGYLFLERNLGDQMAFGFVDLLPYNPFAWQLSLMLLLLGMVIGVWGSVMSVRKFLRV